MPVSNNSTFITMATDIYKLFSLYIHVLILINVLDELDVFYQDFSN